MGFTDNYLKLRQQRQKSAGGTAPSAPVRQETTAAPPLPSLPSPMVQAASPVTLPTVGSALGADGVKEVLEGYNRSALEGKADPALVLQANQAKSAAVQSSGTAQSTTSTNQRNLSQIKSELEAAKSAEKSAMNRLDDYMLTYSGALDLRDPAELQDLKDTATAATEARKRLEQEYNAHEGSFEDQYGEFSGVEKAAIGIIGSPFAAVDVIAQTAKSAIGGDNTMDMDTLAMQNYKKAQQLKSSATENLSGPGKFLADTGVSIAQNLYALPMNVVMPGGSLAVMGTNAAADKMAELGDQGESATRSLVRGAISGGIEAATEKIPLDSLADLVKTGGKSVIKNLLKQGGVEATEEGVAYAANYIADKLAKDPNATWDWADFANNVASGGVSGLFFGLGGTAVNRVSNSSINSNGTFLPGSGLDTPTQTTALPTTTPNVTTTAQNAVSQTQDTTVQNAAPATAQTQKNTVPNVGTEQLTSDSNMERYKAVIDAVFTGGLQSGSEIVVGETPSILQQYGAPDLNLRISQSTVRKIVYPEGYMGGKHNLGMSAMKNLPYQIADPVAILKSKSQQNSMVVITEWKTQDGQDVIVPIHLNKQGAIEVGNSIASAYGKGNIDALLGENGENILYTKNNEDIHQLLSNGLQLPEAMADDVLAKNTIPQNEESVKEQSSQTSGGVFLPGGEVQNAQVGPESSVGAAASGFDPYSNMISEYGIIPEGENPARVVDVPKSTNGTDRISYSARTVMEAEATPDSMLGEIGNAVLSGALSHEVNTDKAAMARARSIVEDKGWDGAKEVFHQAAKKGMASKDNVALGQVLLNNAMNAGDSKTTIDILTDYASMSTTSAQSLQAQRMLKKLSPEGQLYGIQRSVNNMQEELTERYGDKAPNLEIPDDLVQNFLDAQDQVGRDAATEEIYKSIAAQTPSTWLDKWNAWRYMAMLTNPRTHVRNIAGNVGFAPVRMVKDALATAMEAGVDYLSPNGIERTKAALNPASSADRALVKAALADVENVQDQLLGNGKYVDNAAGKIEEYRTIFKFKPLETVRKANSTAMDVEDTWFSKPAYAGALAGYLKANGVTARAIEDGSVDGKVLDAARIYAIREAQRATYRDANAFSDFVSKLHYRGTNPVGQAANVLVEGVLPFRRTPANILVRGVEYSPLGLVNALSPIDIKIGPVRIAGDLAKVRKGEITAAQAIDGISAGLTGTGLLALGVWLASMGLISGGSSGDDDQDAQDDLTGGQNYALSIGGKNFTLDWLAPEALPFFVGVEAYNTWSDKSDGGFQLKDALSAMERITDPMLEMSMLQGVQDMIDNVRYADGGTLFKVMANSAISYLTQAVPTLFGQIERTVENQRYSTYVDSTSGMPSDLQYTIGRVMNKLPGEYHQIPYIDAWGRTEETGSLPGRAFNNFLNPSYVSTEQETDADKELQRLYDAGHAGVFPDRVSQSVQVTYKESPDGESQKRYLTADEYVEYATIKGQTSYDIVDAMIDSDFYKSLTDEQKADAVKLAYTYAGHLAAEEVTDGKHESEKYVELAQTAQKELGLSEAEYLLLYKEYGGTAVNGDKVREAYQAGMDPVDYLEYYSGKSAYNEDGSGSLTIAENAKAIEASGLSKSDQEIMWLLTYPDWAEKASEKGVSNSDYIQYKVATYGYTKKADKLAALRAAGFSAAEAAQLYNKIG